MRFRVFIPLLVLGLASSAAATEHPTPIFQRGEFPAHTEGEILVKYRPGANHVALAELHRSHGARAVELSDALGADRVFFSPAFTVDEMVERYEASPLVEYAHPNWIGSVFLTPNDPYFRDSGIYHGSAVQIDAFHLHPVDMERGWDVADGDGVVIAHIDTGVDFDHPEIAGQIWTNPNEIPGNNIDDDNNGCRDDMHGMDFVGNNKGLLREILFPALYDTRDNNPDVHETGDDGWGVPDPSIGNGVDDNLDGYADIAVSHGTMTGGAIVARMNDALGLPGVAPGAKLMVLRAINAEGMGLMSDIIASVDYAVENGADVINMSLGFPTEGRLLREACERGYAQGVVIVAATGNSASNGNSAGLAYPAAWPTTLAVGSANTAFQRSDYSDFGAGIDVVAPGGDVNMTTGVFNEVFWTTYVFSYADEFAGFAPMGSAGWAGAAGTSNASPIVAGLCALFLELYPNATPAQVFQAVRSTAVDCGATGYDVQTGWGMANARRLTGQTAGRVTGYISPMTQHIEPGDDYASVVQIVNDDDVSRTISAQVNVYQQDELVQSISPLDEGTLTLAPGQSVRAMLPHPTSNQLSQGTYFIALELFEDGTMIDSDDFALNFRRKNF